MSGLEWLEAASYLVTIVGLPFAISCGWSSTTPTAGRDGAGFAGRGKS